MTDTQPGPETERTTIAGALRRLLQTPAIRAYTMLFVLLGIWAVFHYQTDGTFLTPRNLSNLMRQTAVTGILAVGMLLVIVAGQIDLSVGSLVGLTGGVAAIVQAWMGYGLVVSLLSGVTVGLAVGLLQGALVAYVNVPAFIVTLGGLLAWRGAIKGLSSGNTVPVEIQGFKLLGQEYLSPTLGYVLATVASAAIVVTLVRSIRSRREHGLPSGSAVTNTARAAIPIVLIFAITGALNRYEGVPIPVLVLAAIALCGAIVTRMTVFGRYLYAIGGNPDAARLSGIDLRRQVLVTFAVMGALAGVAGIVYTARVGSASPDAGVLLELDAIAACVIGGASLIGGRGTVIGACLGALFMASLDNGMSLQNVEDYKMDIVKGSVLVLAVAVDMIGRRR